MSNWVFRIFFVWYICGFILLTFDLVPPALQWANVVFLMLSGSIGAIYFVKLYSWKAGLIYSLFVWSVSILVEHLGVQYQWWFGHYHYEKDFGPTMGDVPITIGFAWLMVIAGSHEIARTYVKHLKGVHTLGFVCLAAILAVSMDLILDPVAFHVKEYWIWNEGGRYYDIPFSNFTGWFLLAVLFHIFGLLLPARKQEEKWQTRITVVFCGIHIMFTWLALIGGLYLATFLNTIILLIYLPIYVKRRRSS